VQFRQKPIRPVNHPLHLVGIWQIGATVTFKPEPLKSADLSTNQPFTLIEFLKILLLKLIPAGYDRVTENEIAQSVDVARRGTEPRQVFKDFGF
jgi:hypothetical protein